MRRKFKTSHQDWKDRKLLGLSKMNVKTVSVKHDSGDMEVTKADGRWVFTRPTTQPADSAKMDEFIQGLLDLTTDEWAAKDDKNVKTAFDQTNVEVQIQEGDGNTHTVTVGAKADNYYYTKVSGDSTIFKLQEYRINKLKKKHTDLELIIPDTTETDLPKEETGK